MNIKEMSLDNLKKYLTVIDYIRNKAELENRFEFLCIGHEDTIGRNFDNLSYEEYQDIYWGLMHDNIINTPIYADNGNLFINVNKGVFYKTYSEIESIVKSSHKDFVEEILTLDFNSDSSILTINNYEIKISKRKNENYAHSTLKHIFKNGLDEQYFYSELSLELFGTDVNSDGKNLWKTIYRACEDIQKKVLEGTNYNITDFLSYSTGIKGSVRIREKYLKK